MTNQPAKPSLRHALAALAPMSLSEDDFTPVFKGAIKKVYDRWQETGQLSWSKAAVAQFKRTGELNASWKPTTEAKARGAAVDAGLSSLLRSFGLRAIIGELVALYPGVNANERVTLVSYFVKMARVSGELATVRFALRAVGWRKEADFLVWYAEHCRDLETEPESEERQLYDKGESSPAELRRSLYAAPAPHEWPRRRRRAAAA